MAQIQERAARAVEAKLRALGGRASTFADALDDGTPVVVTATVRDGRVCFDFAGTGPESDGNLNAPTAVVTACVLYALRVLVGDDLPLAQGCLRHVEIRVPVPSLLAPSPERAVAGGNVETAQRIVDVLLGALGVCAAAQGTMNNLTFGDEHGGYYETIAGGAGAGPTFAGAHAVQVHMTNTRITDVEVLESRFPVRVRRFAIRRGSGGAGRHRGGDGVVREIEALAALDAAILSERRVRPPFGLAGGGPGARGCNRKNGVDIGGKARVTLAPGDVLTIETPGGGGYGAERPTPDEERRARRRASREP
jgi:5-oxoprolinase (ATP-hydrolysing)